VQEAGPLRAGATGRQRDRNTAESSIE
jgi:hypothetical protein